VDKFIEADTRAKLIDPAIYLRGWTEEHIKREETAGAVVVVNGKAQRRSKGRLDYTLRVRLNPEAQPVAVALLEAKKNTLPPGHGLDQGKGYARASLHNVQFVFSSNGYQFVEFDRSTGLTSRPKPLTLFPTPAELRERYERIVGFPIDAAAAKPLLQRYAGGEGQRRYFQDAAIRAVFEKVARCAADGTPPRALLSLATGTGKTFIAVNLLKRVADAGQLKRALFLCDRDELRTQGSAAMRNLFGSDAVEVGEDGAGNNRAKNARVHIATYQTLGVESEAGDAAFFERHYPRDFFSHIVIDECHRSAWGKWSVILTRNPKAVQVGLTATPRRLVTTEDTDESRDDARITADNLKYFGEPAYEYGLASAMEDGYLAACEISLAEVNLDAPGLTAAEIVRHNPRNALTGQPVTAAEVAQKYERTHYEGPLILPDRVRAMCLDLFQHMLAADPDRGPLQKTIIFCARDAHADAVATEMNNLFASWRASHKRPRVDPYAFKCTGATDGAGLDQLRASDSSHFVATTVDLLTTGVDVPKVRNIVFFRYMKSPITFYQMIGRGTRIDLPDKLMFRVYDYTGATRLFGADFVTQPASEPGEAGTDGPPAPPPVPPIAVDGFEVHVSGHEKYVVMNVDGVATPVPMEDFKAGLSTALVSACPTLGVFRRRWVNPAEREEVIAAVVNAGYSPSVLRVIEDKDAYDLFDVLADMGYGLAPRTRQDRAFAFRYKHAAWLDGLPGRARATVEAIADQFADDGTEGLESGYLFQVPAVRDAGGVDALKQAGVPKELVQETKERMFSA
jgi:type I restriction enzyme R subunit